MDIFSTIIDAIFHPSKRMERVDANERRTDDAICELIAAKKKLEEELAKKEN